MFSEDEGRDLARKRGTEFKLPYAIIDNDLASVNSSFDDFTSSSASIKPPPAAARPSRSTKKSNNKTQLRDYLQTGGGRKRKAATAGAGYHDLYAAAHLVSPYAAAAAAAAVAGSSFYPPLPAGAGTCYGTPAAAEVKPEMLYPYAGMTSSTQNLPSFEDQYRFGYHPTAAALYPGSGYSTSGGGGGAGGAGDFRFDDRHQAAYYGAGANGLCASSYAAYGDQYAVGRTAPGFQYSANYQDFSEAGSSTSPSHYRSHHVRHMSAAGYGLDLSTRGGGGHYDRDVISLYDPTDGMRRRHNAGADFAAASGFLDPLLTTSGAACLYNGAGAAMFDAGRGGGGVLPSLGADGAACSPPTSCCDVVAAAADCYDGVSPQSVVVSTQRSGGDYTVIRKTGYASPTTPPPPPGDATPAAHWSTPAGAPRDVINSDAISRPPPLKPNHTSSPSDAQQQRHDDVTTSQQPLQCNYPVINFFFHLKCP